MTIRDRAGEVLVRTGGLLMIAAGVMIVVPAVCPSRVMTVLPDSTEPVGAQEVVTQPDSQAVAVLTRAAQTTRTTAWRGTQLISVFGAQPTTMVLDVAYVPGVGSWTSPRHGASVTPPEGWLFEAESAVNPGGQPTDWLSLATSHFIVREDGEAPSGRVMSDALVLQRVDGSTAAKVFVDPSSHLIVGREIYDLSGNLLRLSSFSDVVVSDAASITRLGYTTASADKQVSTGGTRLNAAQLASWRAAGWTVPARLHQDFELVDARAQQEPDDPTARLHLTYSDGLSSVSVFGERGRLDPRTMSGWRSTHRSSWPVLDHVGVHDQVAWSDGTKVWTVVADAPTAVVDRVVGLLPHKRDRDAYGQRFTGGLRRIGSWLNPLA